MKIYYLNNYKKAHIILWKEMKELFKKEYQYYLNNLSYIDMVYRLKENALKSLKDKNNKYVKYINNEVICSACGFVQKNYFDCRYCPIKLFYNNKIICNSSDKSPYKQLLIEINNGKDLNKILNLFDEVINLEWKKYIII